MTVSTLTIGTTIVHTKRCYTCHKKKLTREFYVERSRSDGYCPRCKVCERARKTKLYHTNQDFRRRHIEKQVSKNRFLYDNDPEYKKKYRAMQNACQNRRRKRLREELKKQQEQEGSNNGNQECDQ